MTKGVVATTGSVPLHGDIACVTYKVVVNSKQKPDTRIRLRF
uniref:Uncharacterized protein n=1 Tax=Rhizophora mucronata TaxID=61149 RepID=A0A2P2QPJ1_RHIMU